MDLIPTNSEDFEVVYIAAQYCDCGGKYEIKSHQVLLANEIPIDRVHAVCQSCQESRDFFFDIHTIYNQADLNRFEKTEAKLNAALLAIRTQQWDLAESNLQAVIEPEEGEPAFSWSHYHLGLVLVVQGKNQEGLSHIRKAIQYTPGELDFYNGLAKALNRLGLEEEAAQAQKTYTELKERIGQQNRD